MYQTRLARLRDRNTRQEVFTLIIIVIIISIEIKGQKLIKNSMPYIKSKNRNAKGGKIG